MERRVALMQPRVYAAADQAAPACAAVSNMIGGLTLGLGALGLMRG